MNDLYRAFLLFNPAFIAAIFKALYIVNETMFSRRCGVPASCFSRRFRSLWDNGTKLVARPDGALGRFAK